MFETSTSPPIPEIADLADVSLPESSASQVSFTTASDRRKKMHKTGAAWFEQLATKPDASHTESLIDRWLSVASSLLDYSAKNTVLLSLQDPTAQLAVEYDTWNEEYDATVTSAASAYYLWSAIKEPVCPACGDAPRRHHRSECSYDDSSPETWDVGIVGFTPTPVFTYTQAKRATLPVERRLWNSVDSKTAAVQLRDTLIEHHSYYETTPVGVSPDSLSRDNGGVAHESEDGAVVLNIADTGAQSHAKTAEPGTTYLSATPSTDPYRYQAAIEIPVGESPPESAVSASVRQLATAILTGDAAPVGLHQTSRPTNISQIETDARECEAELVAHLISRRAGIDPPRGLHALPLQSWYGESYDDICSRIDRVLTLAEAIVRPADRRVLAATYGADQTSPPTPSTSDALRRSS